MKFGKLLLKKFTKKKTKRTKSRIRPVSKAKTTTLPAVQTPRKRKAPVKAPKVADSEHTLLTTDLIRPSEFLTRSIEGFFLDQRSEHTRTAYGKDLKRFVRFLVVRKNAYGPEALNRLILVGYKEWLVAEKLSDTTVDRHLSALRSFFSWLVEEGHLEKNPAERIRYLNPHRISSTEAFTNEETARVLAGPNLHTQGGAQHYAILMLLFYCGLRRSEVCNLRTGMLGKERGHRVARIRGKGNKERLVVLIPAVWRALQYHFLMSGMDPRKDQFLFTPKKNPKGDLDRPLDPSSIFYIVRRYAHLAGITKRVSPHSCRATAISNARDHKVPDRAIQEFAGWSTPNMIVHYDKRRTSVEDSAAHAIQYPGVSPLPAWANDADWGIEFLKESSDSGLLEV